MNEPLPKFAVYEGYEIRPAPYQVISSKWKLHVIIRKNDGASITEIPFTASNEFDSREEASKHCFQFAKKLIDDGSVVI